MASPPDATAAQWTPAAAVIAPVERMAPPGMQPFSFTGRASEYFGIWITNLLLSILTLGIYSAWAKVRNKRYFYCNTFLTGYAFDYLASPTQILKGQFIAITFFVLWAVGVEFFWWVDHIMLLVVLPLITPWVAVRALTFAARYSCHRNIRFDFNGTVREAFWVYVVLPLGGLLTLGLLLPYAAWRRKRFRIGNSAFGRTPFTFSGSPREFYRAHGKAVLVAFPFLLACGALAYASGLVELLVLWAMTAGESIGAAHGLDSSWFLDARLIALAVLALTLGILVPSIYVDTRLANFVWSHTQVDPHRFDLNLRFGHVLWLWSSNLAAILLSIGLLIPWARVRMARYRIECLRLAVAGTLEDMLAGERQPLAATGDQLGEALNVDLGW